MHLCLLVAAKDEYEYVVHWRISMILPGGGRAKIDIPVSIGVIILDVNCAKIDIPFVLIFTFCFEVSKILVWTIFRAPY